MATSSVRAHHLPSFEVFHGLQGAPCVICRFTGMKSKENLNLGRFAKVEPEMGFSLLSQNRTIIHECKSHRNRVFSGRLIDGISVPRFLESWKEGDLKPETTSLKTSGHFTESDRLNNRGYENWGVSKEASVHESRLMPRTRDIIAFETLEKAPDSWGWLSLGLCGNALITRVGRNRSSHLQGLDCVPTDVQLESIYASKNTGDIAMSLRHCKPSKQRGKNNTKKQVAVARDLFERNSFHIFEVMFSYPLSSPNSIGLSLQYLSRENLRQVVRVINQIAVGLAGMGMASFFFVASRLLSVNAFFGKHQMLSLAVGASFFLVSFSTLKVADILKCIADAHTKAKHPKREHLVKLQRELQSMAFNTFPLLVMCIMSFA